MFCGGWHSYSGIWNIGFSSDKRGEIKDPIIKHKLNIKISGNEKISLIFFFFIIQEICLRKPEKKINKTVLKFESGIF